LTSHLIPKEGIFQRLMIPRCRTDPFFSFRSFVLPIRSFCVVLRAVAFSSSALCLRPVINFFRPRVPFSQPSPGYPCVLFSSSPTVTKRGTDSLTWCLLTAGRVSSPPCCLLTQLTFSSDLTGPFLVVSNVNSRIFCFRPVG